MADRTLTINHADGGSETYTLKTEDVLGVRNMSVDGETVTIDRTAPDLVRTIIADGQTITIDTTREGVRTLTVDGTEITIDRSEEANLESFLQEFTGASAAYSLRDLAGSGNTTVVRVRRASDNSEKDFSASDISSGAMTGWVGAGNDGFVSTWYDQSGNSNDATQAVSASQPKIVSGGSLVSGGLDFDGVDDGLFTVSNLTDTLQSATIFALTQDDVTSGVASMVRIRPNGNPGNFDGFVWEKTTGDTYGVNTLFEGDNKMVSANNDGQGIRTTTENLNTLIYQPSQILAYENGTLDETLTNVRAGSVPIGDVTLIDQLWIGQNFDDNARPFNGTMSEVIIYFTDQSDNRTALEANIGDHYDIDLPSGVDTGYDEVDGFVETWYDQSGNGNDAVQAVAGSQPKIVDAGVLVAPRHLRHTSTVTLPDASQGTQAGKGFTITGLTYDASENCFWAINFGDTIEPVSSTLYPSVVKLSLSFSIISEIDLTPLVTSGESAQGIAVDTSNNSLWIGLAPSTNDVINISKQGTLLNTVSLPDSSGLAYDPTDDTLWTIDDSPAALNHYSKTGTLLDSYSVPFSGADQLAYDAATDSIWCSNGGNGSIGNVSVFHKDTEQWDDRIPLSDDTLAIEGIAIVGSKLFVGNDGYFHNSASTNTIQTFNISNDATIDFSAANVSLTVDTLSEELTGASTAITILRYPITSTQMAFSGTSSSSRRTIFRSSGKYALFAGSSATTASGIEQPSEVPSLAFATFSGTGLGSLYGDGVLRIDQQSVGSNNQAGLTIGQDNDGSPTFTGQFYELLLYNSDQSANREAIETNINNQYDIY